MSCNLLLSQINCAIKSKKKKITHKFTKNSLSLIHFINKLNFFLFIKKNDSFIIITLLYTPTICKLKSILLISKGSKKIAFKKKTLLCLNNKNLYHVYIYKTSKGYMSHKDILNNNISGNLIYKLR